MCFLLHFALYQVQQLQQQVGVLAESQLSTDDLYIRAKQDNAGLNNRILMLEEQTRELEGKGEEKVEDEQKRNNDLIARIERMKNLEIENYAIRLVIMWEDSSCNILLGQAAEHGEGEQGAFHGGF